MGFADLLDAGQTAIRDLCGVAVEYTRGGNTVELSMTPARTDKQDDGRAGQSRVVGEVRDWLSRVADWEFAGAAVFTPQKGDWILEREGDRQYTYEVRPNGPGPCWRYADTYRRWARIHSVLIGVARD